MALIDINTVNKVWIYQRGNQKLLIEEGQTIKWPKENEQKDKQRSTQKSKDQH
jgi:hypothetical protein